MPDKGVQGGIGVLGPLHHRCLRCLGGRRIVQRPAQPTGQGPILEDAGRIAPVLDRQGQEAGAAVGRIAVGKGQRPQGGVLAAQIALQSLAELRLPSGRSSISSASAARRMPARA